MSRCPLFEFLIGQRKKVAALGALPGDRVLHAGIHAPHHNPTAAMALCRTPREARRSRKAAAAYWTPRSLWKISPGAGRSRRTAMFRASRASWVSMRWEKAYPTIFLVHRSLTMAKYSQPSPVGM